MWSAVLWLTALVLVAAGVVGTVLPALPGPILVFAGVFVAAWADDFTRIGAGTVALAGVLTAVAYVVDLLAAAAGVKRSGASRRAVAGAAIGSLAGLVFGLPGFLLGPFVGAMAGELTVRRDLRGAGRAGLFAGLGFAVGMAAKLAIVFTIVGLAATALLIF
jgi:hypothetical protein